MSTLSTATVVTLTTVGTTPFVVPTGVYRMTFKLWGAGGAGTAMLAGSNSTVFAGGSGAFVSCDVTVNPGSTIYLLVGQGGLVNNFGGNTGNALGGGGKLQLLLHSTIVYKVLWL